MDKRLYPIGKDFFAINILPIMESSYIWRGRPPKISHYQVFCAAMYVLRTGISWRDLPRCYGNWNHVYQRIKRLSDRGVWWKVLITLQKNKSVKMRVVMSDSTTVKYHRHGGGLKGGFKAKDEALVE